MNKENFQMRNLTADDIFPICDIIGKCGISEFKNCFLNIKGKDTRTVGINITFEIAGIICRNISKCKKEIYSFLGSVFGCDSENISKLSLKEFTELIKQLLSKKEIRDFFTDVCRLMGLV